MTNAISAQFEFEQIHAVVAGRPDVLFGSARIIGDHRTWWIDAIELYPDAFGSAGIASPGDLATARQAPIRLKPGTHFFDTVRVALHSQCTDQIDERMNRLVEERGGYAALFREAMPRNPFDRGYTRLNSPARVFDLAA